MIDAAHGGAEFGAILNPATLEKDVTLAIARRLRQELGVRGVQAQLVREDDAGMTTDQRAIAVNAAHPALYVAIHATSQGSGIRIYTAMLPSSGDDRGPFIGWERAQSSALGRSRFLQQQITASIQKMKFPVRALPAAVKPLNSVNLPALAVEIAPTTGEVAQLASTDYQEMISAALGNGIAVQRATLEPAP
jgi:N-acetylmuramoyl-L-alanine amidase